MSDAPRAAAQSIHRELPDAPNLSRCQAEYFADLRVRLRDTVDQPEQPSDDGQLPILEIAEHVEDLLCSGTPLDGVAH
jgi:hypothetical protein